jgi:trigger factor
MPTQSTEEGVIRLQVNISNLSEVSHEAEIELTSDELHPHFERAYEKFRPKAELKGFRKGKVPMEMIRKLYGEAIEQDALDTIAGEVYHDAMQERDIHPIGQPALVDMDYRRGERFKFKIKYEVLPSIELKSYKDLAVEKPIHQVSDAEVEAELMQLRRSNSALVPVQAVTDSEHLVTADVQELDDSGAPLIGRKSLNSRFFLSDDKLAPEVRDALSHAETGGSYRVQFVSEHEDHTHTTRAAMTVTKIERVTLPAFDDALVTKITGGKQTSAEEFRKSLHADLQRYWDEQANGAVDDALANEVVRRHEFPVPDSIVEGILDSFVDDIKQRSRDQRLPSGFDEQKYRAESRSYAVWQAKWVMLKEKIAEAERIAVSPEELDQRAEVEASRMGIGKDRLVQYYRSSRAASDRVLSGKIMEFLRSHAKIKETVVHE